MAPLLLVVFSLSGCFFKWSDGSTFGVAFSTAGPQAHVSIYRLPTRRLVMLSRNQLKLPNNTLIPCDQSSLYTRTKCVQTYLRTVEGKISNSFARERWRAAIADDQIRDDMDQAVVESVAAQTCLTVSIKTNLITRTIGYNWTTRTIGQDACAWGIDPVPGFKPAL